MDLFADLGKCIFVRNRKGWRSIAPRRTFVLCTLSVVAGLLVAFALHADRSGMGPSALLPALCGLIVIPAVPRKSLFQLYEDDDRLPSPAPEPYLLPFMEQVLTDGIELLGAQATLLTLSDSKTGHHRTWTLPNHDSTCILQILKESLAKSGLHDSPFALYLRETAAIRRLSIDQDGGNIQKAILLEEEMPLRKVPFQAVLTGRIRFGSRWSGQITLGCPRIPGGKISALRLLRHMVRLAERNYRSQYMEPEQLAAKERERIARDLHDGLAQVLSAADMRIELLRRTVRTTPDNAVDEVLTDVQETLRQKLRMLRIQIDQLRSGCHSSGLEPCLAEIIRHFETDTGISVRFLCDLDADKISPPVRLDVIQIIGEALSNVRQHSHANKVEIRLTGRRRLRLSIRNNGRGFDFAGRFSLADLEARGLGPRMICERVHALGGNLFLESSPETGSRLDIALPMSESILHADTGGASASLDSDKLFWSPKVSQGPSAVDRPSSRRGA